MARVAILIPCYNEAKTIAKVVKDHKMVKDADIYVFDNNSTDDTVKIAKKYGAIIRHEYRQGKGNVIRTMFRELDYDAYYMVDGDDTYPAERAQDMVNLVLEGRADMVIGDRLTSTYFQENKRFGHNFGNVLVRGLINRLFKSSVHDIMTGQRAFSYDFVKSFPVLSKGFQVETEMTIHTLDKNLKWMEVPIEYRDRPEGSFSKLNTIPDGIRVMKTIFDMVREFKPLLFFGVCGLIAFLAAIILGIFPLSEYFRTGFVTRFPTLIVAGVLLIAALLLWSVGLITDLITKKDRQSFEITLNILRKGSK